MIGGLVMGKQEIKNNQLRYLHGWTSKVSDEKQVIFLDYDTKDIDFILDDLRKLQRYYGLSDFYILKTNKGFHAVCLDKLLNRHLDELVYYSQCDRLFYRIGKERKNYTLRLSEKNKNFPEFFGILFSGDFFEKSNAHFQMIKKLASFKNVVIDYTPEYLDKKKQLQFCSYPSRGF